ncbi:hypothetical protein C6V08_33585 [Burkholderia gladioli]|nr:hypothetical protein C6V08_33585 [Burkholderia gladioli]PRH32000.1 hypothetical protein C6V07_27155 [Burkholderia gladioli]
MTRQASLAIRNDALFVSVEFFHHYLREDEFKLAGFFHGEYGIQEWQLSIVFGQIQPDAGIYKQMKLQGPLQI